MLFGTCISPCPNRSLHVGWQMELKPCPIAGNGSAWAPLSIVPCERTFWDDGHTFAVYRQGSCCTAAWHGPFICVCDSKVKLTGAGIVEKRVIDCKGQIEGIDAWIRCRSQLGDVVRCKGCKCTVVVVEVELQTGTGRVTSRHKPSPVLQTDDIQNRAAIIIETRLNRDV